MSQPPNVVTGGIQGIAALLEPTNARSTSGLLSKGGYLYAAATPLSIFGSLGIVKLGISVLFSGTSIPKTSFSFKFPNSL